MFIISRFIRVVRSQLNALLGWAEDPAKLIEQTLLDMDTAYHRAREQTVYVVAEQKKMEKSLADERALAKQWHDRAVLAVDRHEDDLAREALRRNHEHAKLALQLEQEFVRYGVHVEELRKGLALLESKIGEAKRNKNLLIAKQRRAEAQNKIYATLDGMRGMGGLDTIKLMREKIDAMSAVADARVELRESEEEKLEQRFLQLDKTADVETALLELKQRRQIEYKPVESPVSELDFIDKKLPLAVEST